MRRYSLCVRLALCAIVCLGSAIADPSNLGPPVGAILDLAGQPISGTFTQYTVDFTAGVAFTRYHIRAPQRSGLDSHR